MNKCKDILYKFARCFKCSVRLPWKEGHPELPSNYTTSLRRLKTQVARLEKEPEVLMEYALIIQNQLEAGIIERVIELEKAPKVHYLPHQAVVRSQQPRRCGLFTTHRQGKVS